MGAREKLLAGHEAFGAEAAGSRGSRCWAGGVGRRLSPLRGFFKVLFGWAWVSPSLIKFRVCGREQKKTVWHCPPSPCAARTGGVRTVAGGASSQAPPTCRHRPGDPTTIPTCPWAGWGCGRQWGWGGPGTTLGGNAGGCPGSGRGGPKEATEALGTPAECRCSREPIQSLALFSPCPLPGWPHMTLCGGRSPQHTKAPVGAGAVLCLALGFLSRSQ